MGVRWLAIALIACNSSSTTQPPVAKQTKRVPRPLASGESNIARADYIGPEACGECHGVQYALWSASSHRVMNAKADQPSAVIGDFNNVTLAYAGGEVRFTRDGAGFAMTTKKGERATRYRITRTIGRRYLQEYVGIEDGQRDEVRLPFGYWPRYGGWAAQPYFDPWLDEADFDAFAPVREPWAERCPWCHSTYPFAQRIARASGEQRVGHGMEQFYAGAPGSARLDISEQVTVGISCESCHLGGRAHAAGAAIDLLPHGAAIRIEAPPVSTTFAEQRKDPRVVNTVCAQCHSGPSPRLSDGTALRNSSEALDLGHSTCEAKCIDCHDPHRGGSDEARSVKACIGCHAAQAAPAHAGTGHATTTCLDCHMPKLVMGIDRYVRTHRISSPTNQKLLVEAAPNACNLCHLDRTIEWTLTELLAWNLRFEIDTSAYGDQNVGEVWLASKSPAIRLVAMQAYARSPLGPFAKRQIEQGLRDPIAYVRAWAKLSLAELTAKARR